MKRKLLLLPMMILALHHFLFSQVLVQEGFEDVVFPPAGWTILNTGAGNIWAQNTTATFAVSGTQSMVYSYTSSAPAATWAFTPAIQLDSADSITITFDQRVGLSNLAEALKVTVGDAPTAAAQTTVLYNNNNLTNLAYTQRTATYVTDSAGAYYFAFNCFSAADRYKLYVDNIRIAKPILKDALLQSLSIPQPDCALSASEPLTVVIKNNGVDTIHNFPVNYSVNGLSPVIETVSVAIPPGNSFSYTFTTTADLSAAGSYTIKADTDLNNDDDPYNDTLTRYTEHIANGVLTKSSAETVLIPDNFSPGVSSTITFCGLPGSLNGNGFALDYLKIDSVSHSWISDLGIYLLSPSNDSILVSAGNGGGSGNISNVIFTDSASVNIGTINSGGIPPGFYHTESSAGLAAFYTGQNPNGTWKLKVKDIQAGDAGKICKWTLAFKGSTAIFDKAEEFDFEVFPNPTNGSIILHLKTTDPSIVMLMNARGQLLYEKELKQSGDYSEQLQLGHYGQGIYFLQIIQKQQALTKKVVVY